MSLKLCEVMPSVTVDCVSSLCSAACKWLGAFLRNSSGGAVIVSHDQDLLQDACDQIVEVRGRQLHHYAGDYALFLEQRELRSQQAASAAMTQNKKIAELEGFVARFGAKASKASQAQSRAKVLEKMKSNMVAAPAASSGAGPGDARKVIELTSKVTFVSGSKRIGVIVLILRSADSSAAWFGVMHHIGINKGWKWV